MNFAFVKKVESDGGDFSMDGITLALHGGSWYEGRGDLQVLPSGARCAARPRLGSATASPSARIMTSNTRTAAWSIPLPTSRAGRHRVGAGRRPFADFRLAYRRVRQRLPGLPRRPRAGQRGRPARGAGQRRMSGGRVRFLLYQYAAVQPKIRPFADAARRGSAIKSRRQAVRRIIRRRYASPSTRCARRARSGRSICWTPSAISSSWARTGVSRPACDGGAARLP